MIVLGIDPGLTGALAFLDHHGSILAIDDMPTMLSPDAGPQTTVKREVDVCALYALIRERVPAEETVLCAMEHVSVMGGKGSQAIVSLAATKAAILAVLRLQQHDVHRVSPQRWKRFFGLSADKTAELDVARRCYDHPAALKRAKDHNRAEAVLIARWALRNLA